MIITVTMLLEHVIHVTYPCEISNNQIPEEYVVRLAL